MAKIPFDIKYRPQIESGEYKVETKGGAPVHILSFEALGPFPICYQVGDGMDADFPPLPEVCFANNNGECSYPPNSLFIVTPEEELTEFEKAIDALYESCGVKELQVKKKAAKLLALAIDARANELSECLQQSKLDIDSIPYHLIEFMCNLYTCQNWKEIKEIAEAYTTRVKAAALKDLPRWRKWKNGACGNGRGIPLAIVKRGLDGYELVDALGIQGEQYIMLSDLEKLPGFKED